MKTKITGTDLTVVHPENRRELRYIDATPNRDYPLRILHAYLDGDKWEGSGAAQTLTAYLNALQRNREAWLEKAIEILEKHLR